MKGILFFVLFMMFSFSELLYSQTLSEFIARGLETHTDLAQARSHFESSQYDLKAAYATALPSVNLVGQVADSKSPSSFGGGLFPPKSYALSFQVSQPLYLGGRIWNTITLKETLKDQQSLLYEFQKQRVTLELLLKLVQLYGVIEKEQNLVKSQEIQKKLLDVTLQKSKRGNARSYELDQAYAEYYSYGPRLEGLRHQINDFESALSERLSWPIEKVKPKMAVQSLIAYAKKSLSKAQSALKDLYKMALKKRSDYLAQKKGSDLLKLQKKINFGAHLPTFQISGSWGFLSTTTGSLLESSSKNEKYTLDMKIPLFSGLSSVQERRSDEMKIYAQEKKNEGLQQDMQAQIQKYVDLYLKSKKILSQTQNWRNSAQKALISGEKNYRSGFIQQVQMVQLQVGHERAYAAYVDAQTQLVNAYLQLAFQTGEDLNTALK